MALPLKPTLGELRQELLGRLGFSSQGAAAGQIATAVNSYLYRGQKQMYWEYEFLELKKLHDFTLNAGQTLYDWPDDMEPRNIRQMRVKYNSTWHPLKEGIEIEHDTYVDNRYYPRRYDRAAQLEIWPEPNTTYTLRCEYYHRLNRFTQDNDRCTIDDDLVFLHALAHTKAHYKHADAAAYMEDLNAILRKLKKGVHGNKRYFVGRKEEEAIPRPVVV